MINELFKFYKAELTFIAMITENNKNPFRKFFWIGLSIFLILWALFIQKNNYPIAIIATVILICSLGFQIWSTGRLIRKNRPSIFISYFKWNADKLQSEIIEKLNGKLPKMNEEDLDRLQKQIQENAVKSRSSSIAFMTVFGALFIPLWGNYTNLILTSVGSHFATLIIGLLLLVIIGIATLMTPLRTINDDFFSDYKNWTRLNNLITELRLPKLKENKRDE